MVWEAPVASAEVAAELGAGAMVMAGVPAAVLEVATEASEVLALGLAMAGVQGLSTRK